MEITEKMIFKESNVKYKLSRKDPLEFLNDVVESLRFLNPKRNPASFGFHLAHQRELIVLVMHYL